MGAQRVVSVVGAVPLHLPFIHQPRLGPFHCEDEKTLGMTEVLVDLLAVFRSYCDQHEFLQIEHLKWSAFALSCRTTSFGFWQGFATTRAEA
jgi:hypothetical protein